MSSRTCWFVFVALLVVAGCSQHVAPPTTVPVSGSVLFKGKPAAGIRVTLHPQFNMGAVTWGVMGETGPTGEFTIGTGGLGNGAPPGEYIVTLTRPLIESDPELNGTEVEVDGFKGKYDDPDESPWTVSITKGENVLEPFELD